jgi:hypothetical protein
MANVEATILLSAIFADFEGNNKKDFVAAG